jgi:hypothetical protein
MYTHVKNLAFYTHDHIIILNKILGNIYSWDFFTINCHSNNCSNIYIYIDSKIPFNIYIRETIGLIV